MKKVWLKEFSLLTEDGKRIPAAVPGDITSDLLNAGLIPDPLYGENLKTLGSLFESDYTYECEIPVSEDLLSYAYIALDFGGIDTISEVFLNGKKLGSTENMFLAYSFDVKDLLRKGKNLLQVKIFSSLHMPVRMMTATTIKNFSAAKGFFCGRRNAISDGIGRRACRVRVFGCP